MPSAEAIAKILRRKAQQNALEVEHLLDAARTGDGTLVAVIRRLQDEHEWPREGQVGGQRMVPLGLWADVVCRFLEEGLGGVAILGTSPATRAVYAPLCLGLLREIKTVDSVVAVLQISGKLVDRPEDDRTLAAECADALNLILSFKSAPPIPETLQSQARRFLHNLMTLKLSDPQRASAICALRGVGDESSIVLIDARPPLTYPWSGLERQAIRAIKDRLGHRKGDGT